MDAFRLTDEPEFVACKTSVASMALSDWAALDKASLGASYSSIFALDDEKERDTILRPPNASDDSPRTIVAAANEGRASAVMSWPCGRLVPQGHIRLAINNGRAEVVAEGRWCLKPSRRLVSSWGRTYPLTQNHISDGSFTLVRVNRGQYGLAIEHGRPVILREGLHVYNSPLFLFNGFQAVDAEYIQHMSYNVLRVPKGFFAKIWEQSRAKLLPEGEHVVDNPVFKFSGMANSREPYISHGSLHVIQVPKGSLGLVSEAKFPTLLHEGVHIFDSPTLEYSGAESKMSQLVQHGTIWRFRVSKGEVGLAWQNNEPLFIETPGTYLVDSPNFRFVEARTATEKKLALGARKIITVNSGEVGIAYKQGCLEILPPGRHLIESADYQFVDFLTTQQRSMRLKASRSNDLLVCETKDMVSIGIRADVFYRIDNPERALTQVGLQGIDELVVETSIATLTNIMRSTALNEIATSNLPSAVSEQAQAATAQEAQALGQPCAPLFFDKAHDQFIAKLHDDFKARYGLDITNIRIEQFKIMDEGLANQISRQAVNTAETESQLANLAGQTQIATQQQEREAQMRKIQSESDAAVKRVAADAEVAQARAEVEAQRIRAEAEAARTQTKAEADASAVKVRAAAEAEASVLKARAEADGIKLRASAEAERAELIGSTPVGEKLALLGLYSDAVRSSNEGVQKVVYVDPTTTSASNPFNLLTLQSLQRDLQSLQAVSGSNAA